MALDLDALAKALLDRHLEAVGKEGASVGSLKEAREFLEWAGYRPEVSTRAPKQDLSVDLPFTAEEMLDV